MSTMELEMQKAGLVREILATNDERIINNLWLFFGGCSPVISPRKRKIGILNKKAVFHEVGNGKITTEEFLGL